MQSTEDASHGGDQRLTAASKKVNKPLPQYREEVRQFIWQNYLMVVLIALIQGTLDLCLLAYFYIYFYDHKASPAELAVLQGVAALPWVFKPVFGMISDRLKFMGYNRKSYIFAISLVECCMHILICTYKFGKFAIILCNVLQVTCVVFRNVIGGTPVSPRIADRIAHEDSHLEEPDT